MTVKASAVNLPRFDVLNKQGCTYKKNYRFLSKEQKKVIENELNLNFQSSTIRKIDINCAGSKSAGYILNDKIRTHYQTLLVWIDQKKIKGLEILEFSEPPRYKAPKDWYKTLQGANSKDLFKVDALSGATLTRQSTLNLVKQALYFDK